MTTKDINLAEKAFGSDIGAIKGKTTRHKPLPIPRIKHIPIPHTILDLHRHITLSVDYLFVQSVPFLHTISSDYKFRTIQTLPGKKVKANTEDMINGVQDVLNMYKAREIKVIHIIFIFMLYHPNI